uniref:Secreted protein n=1 Tax=Megaselia scalaris TaxID=36166 RepID=T1H1V3_MEGSC
LKLIFSLFLIINVLNASSVEQFLQDVNSSCEMKCDVDQYKMRTNNIFYDYVEGAKFLMENYFKYYSDLEEKSCIFLKYGEVVSPFINQFMEDINEGKLDSAKKINEILFNSDVSGNYDPSTCTEIYTKEQIHNDFAQFMQLLSQLKDTIYFAEPEHVQKCALKVFCSLSKIVKYSADLLDAKKFDKFNNDTIFLINKFLAMN